MHEKLKLCDQVVELQELNDRYPKMTNLANQTYYLKEVQVILGQDCYDIHHQFKFKKSDDKGAQWAMISMISCAFSGSL